VKLLGAGYAVRLLNNSSKKVLNPLEFICDIMGCTEENRIGLIKTRTDESMSNE